MSKRIFRSVPILSGMCVNCHKRSQQQQTMASVQNQLVAQRPMLGSEVK
jgi:hypothetical protein